jgi:hypothetical protein
MASLAILGDFNNPRFKIHIFTDHSQPKVLFGVSAFMIFKIITSQTSLIPSGELVKAHFVLKRSCF